MQPNRSRYFLPVLSFFVILFVAVALLGCDSPEEAATDAAPDDAKAKSVVIFQYAASPLYDHGVSGVIEGLKEKGSMIIVPSSALETMNLGAIGGMTALGQARASEQE